MIPRWTGSRPTLPAIGSRTGTRIVMAAMVSMNIPISSTIAMMISTRMYLFSVRSSSDSPSSVATWLAVRIQAKIVAAATIIRIAAEVSIVSMETRTRWRQFRLR